MNKHKNECNKNNNKSERPLFNNFSNLKTILIPLAFIVVLFLYPPVSNAAGSELKQQVGRQVRRRARNKLKSEIRDEAVIKQASDLIKNNEKYKELIKEIFSFQSTIKERHFFPNVHGNFQFRFIITGDDVNNFFNLFSNTKPVVVDTLQPTPTKVQRLKLLFLRGGSLFSVFDLFRLGRFTGKAAFQGAKKIYQQFEQEQENEERQKNSGSSFNLNLLPQKVNDIIASELNRLIILAVIIYYSTKNKKLPAPLQAITDTVFPKKKQTYYQWSQEKLQAGLDILFKYPHYILLIILIYVFRDKIREALSGNHYMTDSWTFIKNQHASLVKSFEGALKNTNELAGKLYTHLLANSQREDQRLDNTEDNLRQCQQNLAIQNEVTHDCELSHVKVSEKANQCANYVKYYVQQELEGTVPPFFATQGIASRSPDLLISHVNQSQNFVQTWDPDKANQLAKDRFQKKNSLGKKSKK